MSRALLATLLLAACSDDSGPVPDPELAACLPPAWAPDTSAWGARCRTFEDCPSSGNPTTFCEPTTGGYCTELSGPDFVAEGQPCASDPNSIGLTIGSFRRCLAACSNDTDCRPGYSCSPEGACLAITDCESRGCNANTGEPYYCEDGSCWRDRCLDDPCATDDFSTGTCHRAGDAHQCDCVAREYWDPDCQRCGGLVCDALDLGRVTEALDVSRDTCDGSNRFDPTANGCTGWPALGPDVALRFALPPGAAATVTASPIDDFDIAVYVLDDCFDFSAASCLFGEDASGPEVAYVANDGSEDRELVAVVDGAQPGSCGAFSLAIEPSVFQCSATDLGTFIGAAITRTESNCAGTDIYNPGLKGCTTHHAVGSERVYRITLPPQTNATVTMTPSGFDASLYAVSRCGDYGAADCIDGSDGSGSESITLTNPTAAAETFFVVADSFDVFGACGTYDLRVE